MPTTAHPLFPTLPHHLPPVLVRVIHQHDPVSRPGTRESGGGGVACGAGGTCPPSIPTVLDPQVPCKSARWPLCDHRFTDTAGQRPGRGRRHGISIHPLGPWHLCLIWGLSSLQHARWRFPKVPLTLMFQGLGVQSPEVGGRQPPGVGAEVGGRLDHWRTYCKARSLLSWGRNL